MSCSILLVACTFSCTTIISEASSGAATDMSTGGSTTAPASSSETSSSGSSSSAGASTGDTGPTGAATSSGESTTAETTGDPTTVASSTTEDVACCDPIVDGLPCTDECEHDFADVPQFYCEGTCSPNFPDWCQQEDADLFCRLKLRAPDAYAVSFVTEMVTDDAGFCCFGFESEDAVELGPWPAWGVDMTMCYEPLTLSSGQMVGGYAIQTAECAVP